MYSRSLVILFLTALVTACGNDSGSSTINPPGPNTKVPPTPNQPSPGESNLTFPFLPVLSDTDGNPDDAAATYNLSVDDDVPVQVETPTTSWLTPMMRYNRLQLPPVIKAKRGAAITVNVTNNLAEETTIHWHGLKVPAAEDGGPDAPIKSGATRTYRFKIDQAAASLWFHPHAMDTTATQAYKGLAGALIVDDDIEEGLVTGKGLPGDAQDIALLVQDRSFGPDNGAGERALVYGGMMTNMTGMIGDTILVNGAVQPTLDVQTRQYRFRLYNGSNARTYDFALDNGATFKVIGTDGGLLSAPVSVDHLVLASGERGEIIVNFGNKNPSDSVSLIDRATSNRELVHFTVKEAVVDDIKLYTELPDGADIKQRLLAENATAFRTFDMSMSGMSMMTGGGGMHFLINGESFKLGRIDQHVSAGATEVWSISNSSNMAHPFHAHAIQWQILDRDAVLASGVDLGWKDTVLVQPGQTVRIIGQFDPVINKGEYMYHCHILEHEDAGMMGTFIVE